MANSYPVKQKVRCSVTFSVNGTPTDPTTVTFFLQKPNGTEVTYVYLTDTELVRDSAGRYHVDVVVEAIDSVWPPAWSYRFEGSGAVTASAEAFFTAVDRAFY